jgi:hypothetical protein
MATSVVQSGDYELFIDTGFQIDAFVLDSTTKGVLNNTQYVLDGTTPMSTLNVVGATLAISSALAQCHLT